MIERLKYINIAPVLEFIQGFILSLGFVLFLMLCWISCYDGAVWIASLVIVSVFCLYFYRWAANEISMEL